MIGKSLSNEIDPGYLVEQGSKLWLFGVCREFYLWGDYNKLYNRIPIKQPGFNGK